MPPATALAFSFPTAAAVERGTPLLPSVQVIPSSAVRAQWPDYARRQASTLPVCAYTCLEGGDDTGCSDHACLCKSSIFMQSVETCFATTCANPEEWNTAYLYTQQYCAAFGVNIPASSVEALPTDTATAVVTASEAATPTPTPTVSTTPSAIPTIYTTHSESSLTVDIVMGCVCSALLAIALILGGINVRKIYKAEQTHSQLGSRPFTQGGGGGAGTGTQMSHIKSYNNFEYDPSGPAPRSAFAAGPSRGGKSVNRGHDLTHLDARAFNAFPRPSPVHQEEGGIHVHTATTVESTPVSAGFPSLDGHETTVHLGEAVVPVLGREVTFVLEEEDEDKKEVGK